jgi:formate-dependent nitrite reductase membrane component NrfD
VFLGLTGALLIWDLEHPTRFHYLLLRPQWRSWLVRGGFIITGYGAVLAAHLAATLIGARFHDALMAAGIPLAAMTAVYTAYLFAQAKARDMWQSPLLPPHLLVQALLAGSAVLLPVSMAVDPYAVAELAWLLAGASLVHVIMVIGETTLTHGTAQAHAATLEMTRGRYAGFFRVGLLLVALGILAPWWPLLAAPAALVGLLAFEHAYVQAGQSVPLA